MDRPKATANIRMGIQLDTGTAWSSPSAPAPQPHWKTATMTPYAAPMLSRFMTAALSGTTTERNITVSRSTETPTTKAMTSQMRSASMSVMSAKTGTVPVASAPGGRTSARRRSSSSTVRSSLGAVVGSTTRVAARPEGEVVGGETVATPSVCCSRSASAGRLAASTCSRSTAMRKGPLAPGPKPSATRS
jgi:hypothetical protein